MDVVMNAPGMCVRPGTTFDVLAQQLREVLIGPITLRPRTGLIDSPNRYTCGDGSYVDAGHMPNPGIIELARQLPEMYRTAHERNARLRLAVASTGGEIDELPALIEYLTETQPPDIIEVWLSRPYFTANGRYISNLSTAPRVVSGILETIHRVLEEADAHTETAVEVRLPPTLIGGSHAVAHITRDSLISLNECFTADRIDESRLRGAIRPIEDHRWINGVVVSDDLPGRVTDVAGRPVLYTANGTGMIGGRIRSVLMQQQALLVHTCMPDRRIVGHGGIDTVAPQRSRLEHAGISAIQLEPSALLE